MKTWLVVAISLLILTRQDGFPVALMTDQVVYVETSADKQGFCNGHPEYTHIRTLSGDLCVRESFKEVTDAMK